MEFSYVKKLREGTEGEWEVKQIETANRDIWLADSWGDATKEEYDEQIAQAEDSPKAADGDSEGDVPSEDGQVSEEAPAEEVA